MMDHGFFDGPWRGGMSGGKPYIFSQEWRDHLAELKAQRIEAQRDETRNSAQPEGREPDGEADAPNDSREGSDG